MSRKIKIIITVIIVFIIYMAFFDQNNWLLQRERMKNLEKTIENIEFLKKESDEMEKQLQGLQSNTDIIEKTAREKFLHKKDGEDVYIILDTAKKEIE